MLSPKKLIGVFKPEYLFRPQQIVFKFSRELRGRREEMQAAYLPWGLRIQVNTGESLGWSVYTRAIYETAVIEALWRLTKPGDWVVDGGANIGYMTSLLAVRVGQRGRVLSFEPHPEVFSQLQRNVDSWKQDGISGRIELFQVALGDTNGSADLHAPDFFSKNAGTSRINQDGGGHGGTCYRVTVKTLDSIVAKGQKVGLVKLDVEGSEIAVLKGMKSLLEERRVRHLIFEEIGPFPSPTHRFLTELGYSVYGIDHRFAGIRFRKDQPPDFDPVSGPPPNYLATLETADSLKQIESGFWQSFGPLSALRQLTSALGQLKGS
jgi:FkbM family methyltransferase